MAIGNALETNDQEKSNSRNFEKSRLLGSWDTRGLPGFRGNPFEVSQQAENNKLLDATELLTAKDCAVICLS